MPWHLGYEERGRTLLIAHRGASAVAPENTETAFVMAARLGADAIETDARLTRDRVPVAFHDADLARIAGDLRKIEEVDRAELSALVPTLLTLADAAVMILARAGLMLDIKETDPAGTAIVLDAVQPWLHAGRVLVCVRTPSLVPIVADIAPNAPMLALPAPQMMEAGLDTWGCGWLRLWERHADETRIADARAHGIRTLVVMGEPTALASGVTDSARLSRIMALKPDAICLNDVGLGADVQAGRA